MTSRTITGLMMLMIISGCSTMLPYNLAIGQKNVADPKADTLSQTCPITVRLDRVLQVVVKDNPPKNPLEFQNSFESTLAMSTKECDAKGTAPDGASKWIAAYSLDATDPDDDLDRIRENLQSLMVAKSIITDVKNLMGADDSENMNLGNTSQWCGIPRKGSNSCPDSERLTTNKLFSCHFTTENKCTVHAEDSALERALLKEIGRIQKYRDRETRVIVLGYEIPWDEERMRVRYGLYAYYVDRKNPVGFHDQVGQPKAPNTTTQSRNTSSQPAEPTQLDSSENQPLKEGLVGYTLIYTNEAAPQPMLGNKLNQPYVTSDEITTPAQPGSYWSNFNSFMSRPFTFAIGLKNAAFELAKVPFSALAGITIGQGKWYHYPLQNIWTAKDALTVETINPPGYRFFLTDGPYNLLIETPFIGQLFDFNFGPPHADPSTDQDPCKNGRHKIFLSRGIYGGDSSQQDTALWAGWMRLAYKEDTYDIYNPPYEHGTLTDVIWSMFNLSHGPAYNEAKYVIDHAGTCDLIYLAGHSGGVQRSTIASRILANHNYNVDKVLGVAGPSLGQAIVDDRHPHAFRILLNTEVGANEDVVGKIGMTARIFSTVTDLAFWTPIKYGVGFIGGFFFDPDTRHGWYNLVDHIGFSNAEASEVPRKPSTRHVTPFDLSLREPIVFDAYVRSEMATAFRNDLERPSGPNTAAPKTWKNLWESFRETSSQNAFPWKR